MAEPSSSPLQPTRLAFALGALEATVKGLTEEQQRTREAIAELPGKFTGRMDNHEARIVVLEGDKRFVKGGFWVLGAIITIVAGRAFIH